MDVLFNNERDETDDYYAILGCDELSNVKIGTFPLDMINLGFF